jgi:predicted phage tail protein
MALISFALCLVLGGLRAGNPFDTTVSRALAAMAATFVIGLVLGGVAQRMLDENAAAIRKRLSENATNSGEEDR